jgi:hypothetical protein
MIEHLEERSYTISNYLNMIVDMALIYLASIYEAFMTDLVKVTLIYKPDVMKSDKQLSYERVIELHKTDRLIAHIANEEARAFSGMPIGEQAKYLIRKFHIDINLSGVKTENLIRFNMERNLLVHRRGMIDAQFLKVVKGTEYKEGQRITITPEHWQECYESLSRVTSYMYQSVLTQFKPK